MIRHICALAALAALSFASVACTNPNDEEATEVEETSLDLVSRSAYFETFEGLDGRHYFSVMAANGERVLRSEGYATAAGAERGIASVVTNGTDERQYEPRIATNGEHYFNLKAGNGQVIGTSELYASKSKAERGGRVVRALVRLAREELTTKLAPRTERFELFTGEDTKTYFRLRAGNGEIVLASQAYGSPASARGGIAAVQANGDDAARFEIFETGDGEWAVRLVATNGETIARGESYASKSNASRAVDRLTEMLSKRLAVVEPNASK